VTDVPTPPQDPSPPRRDPLEASVTLRAKRERDWRTEGEGTVMTGLAQIGSLGAMILTPALLGLFLGRWIGRLLGGSKELAVPFLIFGVALGLWSSWKWMNRPS
jgi:ATP synthase protein I